MVKLAYKCFANARDEASV